MFLYSAKKITLRTPNNHALIFLYFEICFNFMLDVRQKKNNQLEKLIWMISYV